MTHFFKISGCIDFVSRHRCTKKKTIKTRLIFDYFG